LDEAFLKISPALIKFIVGLPPLGWFFELFVGSIEKKE
jgi:hypothetical protein